MKLVKTMLISLTILLFCSVAYAECLLGPPVVTTFSNGTTEKTVPRADLPATLEFEFEQNAQDISGHFTVDQAVVDSAPLDLIFVIDTSSSCGTSFGSHCWAQICPDIGSIVSGLEALTQVTDVEYQIIAMASSFRSMTYTTGCPTQPLNYLEWGTGGIGSANGAIVGLQQDDTYMDDGRESWGVSTNMAIQKLEADGWWRSLAYKIAVFIADNDPTGGHDKTYYSAWEGVGHDWKGYRCGEISMIDDGPGYEFGLPDTRIPIPRTSAPNPTDNIECETGVVQELIDVANARGIKLVAMYPADKDTGADNLEYGNENEQCPNPSYGACTNQNYGENQNQNN